jgi:hypothetical protein
MEKIEVDYEVSEILAEQVWDKDEDGTYDYWEEYDTQFAGKITVQTDEEDTATTQDELIQSLTVGLTEKGYITQAQAKRVKFETRDHGLTFDIVDWDWRPLYRLSVT